MKLVSAIKDIFYRMLRDNSNKTFGFHISISIIEETSCSEMIFHMDDWFLNWNLEEKEFLYYTKFVGKY